MRSSPGGQHETHLQPICLATRLDRSHLALCLLDSAHEVNVKPEYSGIETEGSPYKLTSTVDGGWRLTIDYPLSQTDAVMKISKKMGRNIKIIYVDPFEGFDHDE